MRAHQGSLRFGQTDAGHFVVALHIPAAADQQCAASSTRIPAGEAVSD